MVYGILSNSQGKRRYEFFHPTNEPENLGRLDQYLQVDPKSEEKNTINTR
jgi:hypothetical protein